MCGIDHYTKVTGWGPNEWEIMNNALRMCELWLLFAVEVNESSSKKRKGSFLRLICV